jgi:hypothetical protein
MKNTKRIIVMNENFIERLMYYISGIIVLISGFMIFHTWDEPTNEYIAWFVALFGWLPDFIYGSMDKTDTE